jgi:hypothetical protein
MDLLRQTYASPQNKDRGVSVWWMESARLYVSKKCFKVNEGGKVLKAKNCEYKYGYEGNVTDDIYLSKVSIYNLTRSDIRTYGIDVELGIYRNPLEYWFDLQMFGKISILVRYKQCLQTMRPLISKSFPELNSTIHISIHDHSLLFIEQRRS